MKTTVLRTRTACNVVHTPQKVAMFWKYCLALFIACSLLATACEAVNCQDGRLGLTPSYPASSCREIYSSYSNSTSGYYWMWDGRFTIRRKYCNMEDTHCGVDGGWTRVAYINMTDPTGKCPSPLRTYTSPRRMCARSANVGCSSVWFNNPGVPYSQICGRAVGYQYATPSAFQAGGRDIDSTYVEGLSVTLGRPRKHIWTFAVGLSKSYPYQRYNCPCATHPGDSPPSFIKNDYFCESGTTTAAGGIYSWFPDKLWDGEGCPTGNSCCTDADLPWFSRTLSHEVNENIEVRWCCNEEPSNEDFGVELLEIYVR